MKSLIGVVYTGVKINRLKTSVLVFLLILFGCKSTKTTNLSSGNNSWISVRQFGAIPDDGKDDSQAIQEAMDFAIKTHRSSIIKLESGIYNLTKGIVIAHKTETEEYQFVSIHLSGNIPAFSSEQRFGATTVFRYEGSGFCISIQSARNCLIENIVFEGNGISLSKPSEIINAEIANWGKNGSIRTNRFSPHCAIAIDPFHKAVITSDRYPGFIEFYSNSSNGGSSMLLIKGCSFRKYFIAISNNSSNGVSNGDNIRAEQCYAEDCHTFWAAGQTQSRNNSIQNVYALFLHTFVSGVEIGKQQGTPPSISNVNIAGFCKYIFNLNTLFSGVSIQHSHMENVWSLGIAMVNSVSFLDCQIQFVIPEGQIFSPPFHLYSNATVDFRNCGIEYFANCEVPAPIMLKAGALQITGGWIEGGVVSANGITNEGGEKINNVLFQNVYIKCKSSFAGKSGYLQPIVNTANEVFIGGESIKTEDLSVFANTGDTYQIFKLGEIDLEVNHESGVGTFIYSSPGLIKKGDNLFTTSPIDLAEDQLHGIVLRPALGYVTEISGNHISIANLPRGISEGRQMVYSVDYPVFIPPIWGSFKVNSPVITDIVSYSHSFYPNVGTRIFAEGLPQGTYVIRTDPENGTITLSHPANASGKEKLLRNAKYSQVASVFSWDSQQLPVVIEGAIIILERPLNEKYRHINISKSILNTPYKATLRPLDW